MAVLPFDIPAELLGQASLGAAWACWLTGLPGRVAEIVAEWELTYDGPPRHGFCALVVPVRTRTGNTTALKVAVPDDESEHEHLALQHWHGNGAVRLLRADPRRRAMLLERLHTEDLTSLRDIEACEVIAGLYTRLHVAAPPQLRSLTSYIDRWREDTEQMSTQAPLPRRLVEQSISLAKDFVADAASVGTLIHGDLHYENVLAGDREPWLAIDPKPMSGDPHYEPAPLLWNRWEEMAGSGDVRGAIRRRFQACVDAAGLDEERARDWVVVRMLNNAMWTITESEALTPDDREWITMCITAAKAVQD